MVIEYIGHSCVFIKENGLNFIIDPFITGNPVSEKELKDLEKIDYIFITHGHTDHYGDTEKIYAEFNSKIICNYEIAAFLSYKNINNVHPMHIGGSYQFEFGKVKMTQALHGSSAIENNQIIYLGNPCGFLINFNGIKIYHAGDTGLTYDMKLLEKENIDYAFIPVGGNYVMDIEDATIANDFIKPKKIIPIHYNTWDIIKTDINKFKSDNKNCFIMEPGEILKIK